VEQVGKDHHHDPAGQDDQAEENDHAAVRPQECDDGRPFGGGGGGFAHGGGDYIAGRAAVGPLDWHHVPFPTCPTEGMRVQYMRAYQFILDSKNWFMNVLMGVVC